VAEIATAAAAAAMVMAAKLADEIHLLRRFEPQLLIFSE
jgi:hypothetical protein